ncbi:MAG TPA: hypothetical protein VK436_11295 [Methanocella sp.]|nr:hypothetical protein [Methanocella sp.]
MIEGEETGSQAEEPERSGHIDDTRQDQPHQPQRHRDRHCNPLMGRYLSTFVGVVIYAPVIACKPGTVRHALLCLERRRLLFEVENQKMKWMTIQPLANTSYTWPPTHGVRQPVPIHHQWAVAPASMGSQLTGSPHIFHIFHIFHIPHVFHMP